MSLGERIKTILTERDLKQTEFADQMGIGPNYVNQLANGKKTNMSETLAKLIEETYGYSAQWVLTGEGEKNPSELLSPAKKELIKRVQKMPEDEVLALLAFAKVLGDLKGNRIQTNE